MAEITIQITNINQIRSAFRKAPRLMTANLNTAIRKSVIAIGRQSRINTPVLTGRLRSSHRESFANLRGEVGTTTNYDVFVHEGTRFMKGRPYLKKAVTQEEGTVNRYMKEAVDNTLKEIGKST